jgi:hypothetical protein
MEPSTLPEELLEVILDLLDLASVATLTLTSKAFYTTPTLRSTLQCYY